MCNSKTAASQEAKLSNDSDCIFFFNCQIFLLLIFEEKNQAFFSSKVSKKNHATKKTKIPSESLNNCANSDAWVLHLHFLLLFS